jgi:LuxR family maltose regulon positive regulatory protein
MISDIMDGVLSGLFYEQNKLVQAKEKIIGLLGRLNEKSHPEFWFSAYMHLAIIAFAEADEKGARNSINMAKSIIERNGSYLVKNLDAVITKYRLYKGDAGAAREWLSNYAAGDLSTVKFYQIYQAFTTIRAYIATGNFALAQVLMAGVEKLAVNYKRPLDHIEILILKSIVFWKEKQQTKAVESMEEAVRLAKPYGFTRIFACEGAAVIPVLQKLCNRISVWPEETDTVVFVRTILLLANETAKFYPGLTSSIEEKPIKLSKQQMRMLLYLAAGKNNRRICSETGLKLNAVKAHLFKLYEKLEVNNSTEAVLKSYQLGIIEKNHL